MSTPDSSLAEKKNVLVDHANRMKDELVKVSQSVQEYVGNFPRLHD